jgi:Leucine-rich repeat (LRR) protein
LICVRIIILICLCTLFFSRISSKLPRLTVLELGGNQLSQLPMDIGQISTLTKLDVNQNSLTELPVSIRLLEHLTVGRGDHDLFSFLSPLSPPVPPNTCNS